MTMTTSNSPTPGHVVIVGGGVAGLEALLALQALAGDRVDLTLVSQHDWFVDRPVTVAEPFGLASAARHSVPDIVAERGARFVGATVVAVHADAHRVSCADGTELSFDTLILAPGARLSAPVADAIAFGLEGSGRAIGEMLDRLRSGEARSVAFVAPSTTGWLLPLYELALMTARELARSNVEGVQLRLLSPEDRPLALFGDQGSQSAGRLLAAAGIEFIGSTADPAAADYVVTLPLLRGPELAGVPTTPPDGFVAVDEHGQVRGLADVYAAGDGVDFPVKQGGLAAQQADAVAEHIAAAYGASVDADAVSARAARNAVHGRSPALHALRRARRRPGRSRRLVSALVAADEDRRPLPCALPVRTRRRGGAPQAARRVRRRRHPACRDDAAGLISGCPGSGRHPSEGDQPCRRAVRCRATAAICYRILSTRP